MTERPDGYEKEHERNLKDIRDSFPQAPTTEIERVYNAQRLQLESVARNFQYVPFFALKEAKATLSKSYPTTQTSPPSHTYETPAPAAEPRRVSWLSRWLLGR